MGCCMSSPKEGSREPHSERAESTPLEASGNERSQKALARKYREDAPAGWVCIPCHHYNDGERSNSRNCSRCQVAVESSWDVKVLDNKEQATTVKSAQISSHRGWYHSASGMHY